MRPLSTTKRLSRRVAQVEEHLAGGERDARAHGQHPRRVLVCHAVQNVRRSRGHGSLQFTRRDVVRL